LSDVALPGGAVPGPQVTISALLIKPVHLADAQVHEPVDTFRGGIRESSQADVAESIFVRTMAEREAGRPARALDMFDELIAQGAPSHREPRALKEGYGSINPVPLEPAVSHSATV
jgi:hypothetical protein